MLDLLHQNYIPELKVISVTGIFSIWPIKVEFRTNLLYHFNGQLLTSVILIDGQLPPATYLIYIELSIQ